jgi:hypothetical protein
MWPPRVANDEFDRARAEQHPGLLGHGGEDLLRRRRAGGHGRDAAECRVLAHELLQPAAGPRRFHAATLTDVSDA